MQPGEKSFRRHSGGEPSCTRIGDCGATTWENVVAACSSCNLRKGNQTLRASGLSLRRPPRQPGAEELRNVGRRFPPDHLHVSWLDYLYWDAELDA